MYTSRHARCSGSLLLLLTISRLVPLQSSEVRDNAGREHTGQRRRPNGYKIISNEGRNKERV